MGNIVVSADDQTTLQYVAEEDAHIRQAEEFQMSLEMCLQSKQWTHMLAMIYLHVGYLYQDQVNCHQADA